MKDFKLTPMMQRLLLAIGAAVIIVWFYPHARQHQYIYEQGRPWNYAQLIAPFDIPIHPDSATVQAIRDTLQASFVPIYTQSQSTVDSIIAQLPADPHRARTAALIASLYKKGVITAESRAAVREGKLPKVRVLNGNILSESSTVSFQSPREIYLKIDSAATDPAWRRYISSASLAAILTPNVVYNETECRRYYDNEFQTLTADRGVILQGQAIINKGDIVSAQDFTNLRTYESLLDARSGISDHANVLNWIGQFLFVSLLLGLFMAYLAFQAPDIYGNPKALSFLYSLITLFFLFSLGLSTFVPGGIYIVPLTIVPILVQVFFNARTALFTSAITILLIAPITSYPFEFIYLQFSAASVGVFSLRDLSRRSQLLRTALLVAATYCLGYFSLELLTNGSLDGWTWRMPVFLAANAVMVSMAYILMSAVERVYGFVSTVTLVELSDTNQPLLRELSDKCPGTFQHSMGVGNLASDAARAMGANEPLVRAGALYHDIGKMSNPAFFTENQHGINPHDALAPEQSARIVINHVADGLTRAEKAGLPAIIKDFIRQHHGAGRAKYFYFQAAKNLPEGQQPDPAVYTYPGPNPQTRENSLLMMADAVEAASRSLADYSKESIKALVDKIIDGQIADHLHDESSLQFADIQKIKAAFVKRLTTMYHTRIAYPEAKKTV